MPPATQPAASSRLLGMAVGWLIAMAAGIGIWWLLRTPPTPPGEADQARSQRERPNAPWTRLVGTDRCADCHPANAAAHASSGHSRALARTRDSAIAMSLCGQTVPAADGYGPYQFACDDEGLLVGLPEKFGERLFPVDFAFGSGEHAVTFLTLTPALDAEDGVLGIEHRNTWYRSRDGLGVTPGQQHWIPEREIEAFGKAFQGELLRRCLNCHTTSYQLEDAQLKHLVAGVQCERCHGPGDTHVAAAEADHLAAARSTMPLPQSAREEIELCGRCHRMPSDITEERLARYPPSVTRFQPIGLLQSRCYLESDGALRCTTCHDAHAPVTSRSLDEQIETCRNCHQTGRNALCAAGHTTDCIGCHMQKLELIPGIFFHDHWIRSRPKVGATTPVEADSSVSGEPSAP